MMDDIYLQSMKKSKALFFTVFFIIMPVMAARGDATPQWRWEDAMAEHVTCIGMNSAGTFMAAGTTTVEGMSVMAVFESISPWPISRIEFTEHIFDVEISEDGQLVACAVDHMIYLYDGVDQQSGFHFLGL